MKENNPYRFTLFRTNRILHLFCETCTKYPPGGKGGGELHTLLLNSIILLLSFGSVDFL